MFSCEFCEIFKNTFFNETTPVAASEALAWLELNTSFLIQRLRKSLIHFAPVFSFQSVSYSQKFRGKRSFPNLANIRTSQFMFLKYLTEYQNVKIVNLLNASFTKCSNALRQFVGKMVKHIQTIRRLLLTNCLIVFDNFVGLALKELNQSWV